MFKVIILKEVEKIQFFCFAHHLHNICMLVHWHFGLRSISSTSSSSTVAPPLTQSRTPSPTPITSSLPSPSQIPSSALSPIPSPPYSPTLSLSLSLSFYAIRTRCQYTDIDKTISNISTWLQCAKYTLYINIILTGEDENSQDLFPAKQ
jgi:hypothetical protein